MKYHHGTLDWCHKNSPISLKGRGGFFVHQPRSDFFFVIPTGGQPLAEVEGSHERMREHNYYVYILSNPIGSVLYIGVTNNLLRRVEEHRSGTIEGFTKKYGVKKLLFFEHTTYVYAALEREKQLKRWNRKKKEWLIDRENPKRIDLYDKLRDPSTSSEIGARLRSG